MADRYWLGVDGNWTNTSNWSTTRGGSGGSAVPTTSDDVFILDGSIDITQNISAINAAAVKIGGNFTGALGGSANPANFDATSVTVDRFAGSSLVIGGHTGGLDLLTLNSTGSIRPVISAATTTLLARGTQAEFSASASITNVRGVGADVIFRAGATHTTLDLRDCSCTDYAGGDIITIDGGSYNTLDKAAIGTNIDLYGRARFRHNSSGTIVLIEVGPQAQAVPGDFDFEVTDSVLWQGGKLFENFAGVTYTNATTTYGPSKT